MTKSALVLRDLDNLRRPQCLPRRHESRRPMKTSQRYGNRKPLPSPSVGRSCARRATTASHHTVMFGPLLPGISDTQSALDELFGQARCGASSARWTDLLNPRTGVWPAIRTLVGDREPAVAAPHPSGALRCRLPAALLQSGRKTHRAGRCPGRSKEPPCRSVASPRSTFLRNQLSARPILTLSPRGFVTCKQIHCSPSPDPQPNSRVGWTPRLQPVMCFGSRRPAILVEFRGAHARVPKTLRPNRRAASRRSKKAALGCYSRTRRLQLVRALDDLG